MFGKKLKELRLEKNLSQKRLGEFLGVCNQTVSFWESGAREPNLDDLVEIARFFGVTADELLEER